MRRAGLMLALLACLSAARAATINGDWVVSGAPQARPVQAFDDGTSLYIQLRDPTDPPAPIGPGGPLSYRIRGYYMVVPLTPRVVLRYGPHEAVVESRTAAPGAGIVSVTRPVGAAEVEIRAAEVQHHAPLPAAPVPASAAQAEFGGEIVVSGPSGVRQARVAEPETPAAGPISVSFDEAERDAAWSAWRGKRVRVLADGTTAGARAAQRAQAACAKAGAKCEIEYRGSVAGRLQVVEAN